MILNLLLYYSSLFLALLAFTLFRLDRIPCHLPVGLQQHRGHHRDLDLIKNVKVEASLEL